MFISIIICIYKTEKYLRKCIDSIKSQCFSNYEILLVDDGSPDENKIIDTFKSENIKIYHKEHSGLASSRNYGLKLATGKYIWFVDPDDEIEPNSLSTLFKITNKSNCDILRFNYRTIKDNKNEVYNSIPSNIFELDKLKQLRHFIVRNSYVIMQSCWMHIYKRDLIKDIEFVNEKEYAFDDVLFNLVCFQKTNKIETCNEILYRYYKRIGSITQGNKLWLKQLINAYEYIKKKYTKFNIFDEYKDDLINAFLDDAMLGRGNGNGGALFFEYSYTSDVNFAHAKVENIIKTDTFKELLYDSYGHKVNEKLMNLYDNLYKSNEKNLYNLLMNNSNSKNKSKTHFNEHYKLKNKFIKTQINDEYVLVPINENNNGLNYFITISDDGCTMLEYIEQYGERNLILNNLYSKYSEYDRDEIESCFNDFVVKLESEKILVRIK